MRRSLVFLAAFILFFFIPLGFTNNFQVKATDPLVMLDEFVVYPATGGEEWIELLNPSQTTALDLTGWRLVIYQGTEPDYTYHYSQDLSGSVPRGGFLTFTVGNGTTIPNEGACLVIFRTDTESVYAVKYGNGSCDVGAGEQNATSVAIEQGKSIYYNLDEQTWNSTSSTTRGWCNPGSGDCPTISTITGQLTSESVATNLGDQTDFSRISGLYFLKSQSGENIGKITFLAEMNFTDRDALTWMQSLDSKLDISQGVISLDADLIKNLTNTNASLTMYSITLSNPKILVDGQDDNSGIVSGLTYDQTAHTLTFTAAHFTTFTAVENSGTSSSGSSAQSSGPPACGDWPPLNAPRLFQIDTTKNSATLYFMPVSNYLSYYYIAYGFKEGDWRFGTQFNSTQKIGVVSTTINCLSPNTTYYFTVRGGNGCAPGNWSNYLSAETDSSKPVVKTAPTVDPLSTISEPSPTFTPQPTIPPLPTSSPLPTPTPSCFKFLWWCF